MPDDLVKFHKEWDIKLVSAFKTFNQIDQPLLGFLPEEIRQKTALIGAGKKEMDSILNCYFHQNGITTK